MTEAPKFSPQDCYDWLRSQRNMKKIWLDSYSSGKYARPEFEILQKQKDWAILEYMVTTYERKFAGDA